MSPLGCGRVGGADPWSARVPPDPLCARGIKTLALGDRPARGPAADRAGVRISARRDLAAELPVRSVLDGNRQILGDQPAAIFHKAVWRPRGNEGVFGGDGSS